MHEIRVLSGGQTVLITSKIHLSDHAAIRFVQQIAADRSFEVWRGMDRIYGGFSTLRISTTQ